MISRVPRGLSTRQVPLLRHADSLLILLTLTIAAYARTFAVPWYFDDRHFIVENPLVHDLGRALGGALVPRGLTVLTLALNWRIGGADPTGYHAFNLAVHLATAVLAFALLLRLFPGSRAAPLFGALLFALHPLQTQAVTYVSQRAASLAGLCGLAALLLFLLARDRLEVSGSLLDARHLILYLGSLLASTAALLAKETGAIVPALLLLVGLLLHPRGATPLGEWRLALYTLPFLVYPTWVVVRIGLRLGSTAGVPVSGLETDVVSPNSVVTPIGYLFTEFGVIWSYVGKLFLPVRQLFDAGLEVAPDPFTSANALSGFALMAAVAAAWWLRRRAPGTACGILWFLVALAPESSILPLDPYFEHRLYLPLFGFALALADGAAKLGRQRPVTTRACSWLVVAVLFALTLKRNEEWRDPVKLWSEDLAHGSQSYRSVLGLADALFVRGDQEASAAAYRQFVDNAVGRCQRERCGSTFLVNAGVSAERIGDLETAQELLERAVAQSPRYALAHFNLGLVFYRRGDLGDSREQFRVAHGLHPGDADAIFNLGVVSLELGELEEARAAADLLAGLSPERAQELAGEIDAREPMP